MIISAYSYRKILYGYAELGVMKSLVSVIIGWSSVILSTVNVGLNVQDIYTSFTSLTKSLILFNSN